MEQGISMSGIANKVHRGRRGAGASRFMFGAPLVAGTIVCYLGIAQVLSGRFEVDKEKDERDWELLAVERALSREGPLKNFKLRKPTTLEEELKELQKNLQDMEKKININDFEYKPVPRSAEK